MAKRQVLLLSSSNVHGHAYLEYAVEEIKQFLNKNNVKDVLFIPYALRDYDGYLKKVKDVFTKWGYNMSGIHQAECPIQAVKSAQSIFVGGGNTFLLLKTLYEKKLVELIRTRVMDEGMLYMGTSAGTNVATVGIHTTNDMPITQPPSLDGIKLVPFNINPHYLDPEPDSKHKGETREERILQYLELETSNTVLGLREGSTLLVDGNKAILKGIANARLFVKNSEPKEISVGADLSYLLEDGDLVESPNKKLKR